MNVIVPLGGLGTRFQNEGYLRPKPFVRVLGKEMIHWVLDSLSLGPDDSLVIVFNPAFLSMDVFMRELVQSRYTNCILVELAGPTRGAAETVLLGLKGMPERLRKRPCMLCDGDCFYSVDVVSMYRAVSKTHNATFTFVDTQPKPLYSYVTVASPNSDEVVDIKEKIKISDDANSGCYCFKDGGELEKYCERIIEAGAMQLSQDQKGEFYTSGVIKAMLDDRIPCRRLRINKSDIHVLGTPTQLSEWCTGWKSQPRTTIAFSVLQTLLMPGTLAPITRNIDYARQLHAQGHTVILIGRRETPVVERAAIELKLAELAIPYDALEFSQPDADLFIDALAVDAMQGTLASHVGIYLTNIAAGCNKKFPKAPAVSCTNLYLLGGTAVLVTAAVATAVTAVLLRRR